YRRNQFDISILPSTIKGTDYWIQRILIERFQFYQVRLKGFSTISRSLPCHRISILPSTIKGNRVNSRFLSVGRFQFYQVRLKEETDFKTKHLNIISILPSTIKGAVKFLLSLNKQS